MRSIKKITKNLFLREETTWTFAVCSCWFAASYALCQKQNAAFLCKTTPWQASGTSFPATARISFCNINMTHSDGEDAAGAEYHTGLQSCRLRSLHTVRTTKEGCFPNAGRLLKTNCFSDFVINKYWKQSDFLISKKNFFALFYNGTSFAVWQIYSTKHVSHNDI